jgi:hypothetical protein
MKIAIPIPTHLFGLLPIAWDLPEHDFYLVRTPNYNPTIENYNQAMWTHHQPNIHGTFKNVHETPLNYRLTKNNLDDYDLLFTIYEGNTTWTAPDKPIVPYDWKIPQIWQAFGSYIHRNLMPYLHFGDKLNPKYIPAHAVFRWENTVVEEANKDLKGKTIYVSADPTQFNGWIGNEEKLLTVYSHKNTIHKETDVFNILKHYTWIEYDYTTKGIQPLNQLITDTQHARCYVDPTHRYSPGGISKTMMIGCPCIAWYHREWLVWIRNGINGFLCGSYRDFEYAIQRLMRDYEFAKQMSMETRKRALMLFDPKLNHDKWIELIEWAKEKLS